MAQAAEVTELLARSNRLGSDPRNTNYAGGNTSAKGRVTDPVTGEPAELLWVKGSGGDLGTLTAAGLAVLRLDRLRALTGVYPGVDREDEMVAAFDFCLHGKGGAAPSIDTAMHGLVDAPHVDHLHPDSGIALATAADGEALTRACFGDRVLWVPWRRPGFQLGLDIAAVARDNPGAIGVILGGHGITAWGATSDECEARSLEIIATAQRYLDEHGSAEPFGPPLPGYEPLPDTERHLRAAALAPVLRGLASTDRRQVGHFTDRPEVLDFTARAKHPALAALGTSCPDHFLRTKVRPMVLDLPPSAPLDEVIARLRELHAAYREDYRAYYERNADAGLAADARRRPGHRAGAGGGHVQLRRGQADRAGGGRVLRQRDQRDARRRGGLLLLPHRASARSSASSTGRWRRPSCGGGPSPGRWPGGWRWSPGAAPGSAGPRRSGWPPRAPAWWSPTGTPPPRRRSRSPSGPRTWRSRSPPTSPTRPAWPAPTSRRRWPSAAPTWWSATPGCPSPGRCWRPAPHDWDLQHDVMARGSFLVAREAARTMQAQGMGGDIIYICSKNSVFAGPNNVAYGAAKADQAHQVRLLAAELGAHGIRVNGINPDGVVRGSGIFAGGWGAQRAAVYGVPEEDLGAYYAQRTLLKREVLPEHVAAAVIALTAGDLALTTGLHIPVDAGVAAAFLR